MDWLQVHARWKDKVNPCFVRWIRGFISSLVKSLLLDDVVPSSEYGIDGEGWGFIFVVFVEQLITLSILSYIVPGTS